MRHLQPLKKELPLSFGIAIHEALDKFYTEGLDSAIQRFKETFEDVEEEQLRTVANGVKLLKTYAEKYAREPFKVIAKPEGSFLFKVGDVDYVGKIDLPVEWDGQLWIMEHKTTSYIKSGYFDQFMLDKQPTGYVLAAEAYLERPCIGCIINVLEPWKELVRPTAKSKQPFDHFVRYPLTKSKEHKERFKLNVQRIVRDIEWCKENDEWYEAENKNVCVFYQRKCPYFDLCFYGENERILSQYKVEEWNPCKKEEDVDATL